MHSSAHSIFSCPIIYNESTFNTMCFDENHFTCQCEKVNKKAPRLQILHSLYLPECCQGSRQRKLVNMELNVHRNHKAY